MTVAEDCVPQQGGDFLGYFASKPDGRIVAQAKSFEEDLVIFDSETMQGDMHEQITVGIPSAFALSVGLTSR